jgi:hypothetical protein
VEVLVIYPIYDVDESIYLIYGDDNPPIIG